MSLLERMQKQRINQQQEQSGEENNKQVGRYVDVYEDLKSKVHQEVINEINKNNIKIDNNESNGELIRIIDEILEVEAGDINRSDRSKISADILNDIAGHGPLEVLLQDPDVTEIMVNGPNRVYIEKKGKLQLSDVV
ncbi:MAG: hypothetical protein Q8873_06650, partial [Bacillota bacterium]|nr:hypothetical protein [Bacillota bacterium]